MIAPYKPTKEEIRAAHGSTMSDIIQPNLRVLFCGINPSLYSAAVGHHFARPGNRFWAALHGAGFTDRRFSPFEDRDLLKRGCGITNVADRATATADELTAEELIAGGQKLADKVQQYRPQFLAVLGISAYRTAFGQRKAVMGRQPKKLHDTVIWVLPNPSGLNAHYQLQDLTRVYQELFEAIDHSGA